MSDDDHPSELVPNHTLRAVKLVGGGRGLAHADGATWMVRGALPGELLTVRPVRRRASIVEADTIEVAADPHPARLASPCPHAVNCGGCDWAHVDAEAGAFLKTEVAAESTGRSFELADRLRDAPVTGSPPSYRLRCRLHWDPHSRALGFYAPRSRKVTDIAECRIITPSLRTRLIELSRALTTNCPAPIDLEWLEGDDGTLAALRPANGGPGRIPSDWVLPPSNKLGVVGFHRLSRSSDLLPGWGRQRVRMDLPIPLHVPIGSFFQGNRHLIHWLFRRVAELVGEGREPVFDLHAGVGFLAAAAQWAGRKDIIAVEAHRPSAAAASTNLPNARVVAGTAESFVETARELPHGSVVITDPPRSGLSPRLRQGLVGWHPNRLIMLGCDPATWSRDAAFFMDNGYHLGHVELVDLFPFTHHVEILAYLEST